LNSKYQTSLFYSVSLEIITSRKKGKRLTLEHKNGSLY